MKIINSIKESFKPKNVYQEEQFTIPLGVKFDVVNKNDYSIPKEVFKEALEKEHIEELLKTNTFYISDGSPSDIKGNVNMEEFATTNISDSIGRICTIDIDKGIALIQIRDTTYAKDYLSSFKEPVLIFNYIGKRTENNHIVLSSLSITKAFIIENDKSCYNI